jgi:hypothetical protein
MKIWLFASVICLLFATPARANLDQIKKEILQQREDIQKALDEVTQLVGSEKEVCFRAGALFGTLTGELAEELKNDPKMETAKAVSAKLASICGDKERAEGNALSTTLEPFKTLLVSVRTLAESL